MGDDEPLGRDSPSWRRIDSHESPWKPYRSTPSTCSAVEIGSRRATSGRPWWNAVSRQATWGQASKCAWAIRTTSNAVGVCRGAKARAASRARMICRVDQTVISNRWAAMNDAMTHAGWGRRAVFGKEREDLSGGLGVVRDRHRHASSARRPRARVEIRACAVPMASASPSNSTSGPVGVSLEQANFSDDEPQFSASTVCLVGGFPSRSARRSTSASREPRACPRRAR